MSPGQPTPSGDVLLHEPRNELLPSLLSEHLETVVERCEEAGLSQLVGTLGLALRFTSFEAFDRNMMASN